MGWGVVNCICDSDVQNIIVYFINFLQVLLIWNNMYFHDILAAWKRNLSKFLISIWKHSHCKQLNKYILYFPKTIFIKKINILFNSGFFEINKNFADGGQRIQGLWFWYENYVNSYPPRQNGHHFTDNNFKCNLVNKIFSYFDQNFSQKFVFKVPIDNNPALVLIMAWCRIVDKPLSEPTLTWFTDKFIYAAPITNQCPISNHGLSKLLLNHVHG